MGTFGPLLFCGKVMTPTLNEDYVQAVLAPVVPGVDVLLVESAGARSRRTVRVFIDHPEGVTLDLCSRVSRILEEAFDRANVLVGAYTIEVSSPGLDRPLRTPGHFAAQRGKRVRIRTTTPVEGRRAWEGVLIDVGEDAVVLRQDGVDITLRLANVAKANLVYEFEEGARE